MPLAKSQLGKLSVRFDKRLIDKVQGNDYVNHASVTERALSVVGPYSIQRVELIYDEKTVTGALVTIACEIDGRQVQMTEAGECSNPTSKTNGAKAKDSISDAVKRCWMRLGLGLHLWSQEHYVLDKVLERDEKLAATLTPVYTPEEMGATVDGEGDVISVDAVDVTPTQPEKPVEPQQTAPVKDEGESFMGASNGYQVQERIAMYDEGKRLAESQEARCIGPENGVKLYDAIEKLGFDSAEIFAMADTVCETLGHEKVTNLATLDEKAARKLIALARRETPASKKTPEKPVWETWKDDSEAQAFGAQSGVFKAGQELMTLWGEMQKMVFNTDIMPGGLHQAWFDEIERLKAEQRKAA